MRKATLTAVGIVGLSLLLCGSGEVLAQTDRTAFPPGAPGSDATDSRVQGAVPGDVRVGAQGTASPGTQTTGTQATGTQTTGTQTTGTQTTGTQTTGTGGSSTAATGAEQAAGGAGASPTELRQSVLQLQSEVAQLRQELAQVRAELANVIVNTGVGGSGQAGTAPGAAPTGAGTGQDTAAGRNSAQGAVSGGTTGQGTAPRAGTSPGTAQRGTQAGGSDDPGEAVVNAIYTGKVRSVSGRQLVLLDDSEQPFTVELGAQTRFISNGQRISAQQLEQGTRVRATVDLLSGRNQATEVTTVPER